MIGILQPPSALPAPPEPPGPDSWRLETLAGWHLPLLTDPAFLPLQPVLQRAVLLGLPERLMQALLARPSLAPQVLVALSGQKPLGLIICRRLNRSGSCWQMQHLRLAPSAARHELASTLLRAAIQRARGAASWIAAASTLDDTRLAMLREQGFQPLRSDRLWCWPGAPAGGSPISASSPAPAELQLTPLNRRSATLLWHLEQAACPAQLRQLLDRRVEDLLDQSHGRGWMLVDPSREQAVAAVRWIGEHPGGGHDVELSVHPGWEHLVGTATELLLHQAQADLGAGEPLWLRCDLRDEARQRWLADLGAQEQGERVLMARSVWRRQGLQAPARAAQRIDALLEQWQPRRRPLPTPTPLAPPL
ncbi:MULTISPECIES: GNAT family N-acetyltransferase [Cyanobium]|uniref:GNAT family N-acetyltransferase n=1 Tax=Cyanobium TaxID=167375 RepID=UPI000E3EC694|nr:MULTISPECIES: GNAT family N-acetyltransferase [Cyanobium]MCP9779865.1 GNAT family N-acetyltransferase [Cyanobium sp. To12R1]